jgi:poly-gamma-glutamate synthesis protein (capsule biosynthesis protein)
MTGRGVDQVLPHPCDPQIYEAHAKSATEYVRLAEQANGPIQRPMPFADLWGDALTELDRRRPDARIINLEAAVTQSANAEPKGINYRMSPENAGVIAAAGIDCCVLANNHVLDWGHSGLLETLATLADAGVTYAGAGQDDKSAEAPATLTISENVRLLVFALACPDAGAPPSWAAGPHKPGVNLVTRLTAQTAQAISRKFHSLAEPHDLVLASIHWGSNWGYEIPHEQTNFAHHLVDFGGVDIVFGHSSHHPKGIEVYRDKLIVYGCGDFIDDYEGIRGYEAFRDDLVLMYFPKLRLSDGTLVSLEMVPLQIRNMRLHRASRRDAEWLASVLNREGKALHTGVELGLDGVLRLEWE